MKAIELTSLILLSLSLLVLVLIGGGFALDRYVSSPPIFQQSQDKDFSFAKGVREATNLEGLKKVCLFWAEREDQFRAHFDAQSKGVLLFIREVVTMVALLAIIFSIGSFYIYLSARRAQRANAL